MMVSLRLKAFHLLAQGNALGLNTPSPYALKGHKTHTTHRILPFQGAKI
jgi:hypothetical protein